MKKRYLLFVALFVTLLPSVLGPASAGPLVGHSEIVDCSSEPLPLVIHLSLEEILVAGRPYLVKGPLPAILDTFSQRQWAEPFGQTSNWVAHVVPTEDTSWPPDGYIASGDPEYPFEPDALRVFNAWQIVEDWRAPFLMHSPLEEPIDVVSLGEYDAGWVIALEALDHLNHYYQEQDRHAWIYLVRADGSEQLLAQIQVADPAFAEIIVPEPGKVEIRTHDSIIWWVQCWPPPSLTVTKAAMAEGIDEPGGPVDYTVEVQNTNPFTLTLTSLLDDPYGDVADAGNSLLNSTTCALPQIMGPGGLYACGFNASFSGQPGDSLTDVVSATAQDEWGREVTDDDDATVEILDVPSSIRVIKTPDPNSVLEPGADVVYTVTVQNTGPVDDVTVQTLADDQFGDIGDTCNVALPVTLSPGQGISCAFTEFIGGKPGDIHLNVATATGVDDDGNPVMDEDDAEVRVLDLPSSIQVVKTATPDWMYEPGGDVTFDFSIRNTSAVDDVIINLFDDTIYGDLNGRGDCSVPQFLPVGSAAYTCSFTVEILGEADDIHTNVVTAAGIDDDGQPVQDQDDATVKIAPWPAQIELLAFSARDGVHTVTVLWETGMEQDNWGFNLYRGQTAEFDDAAYVHFETAQGTGLFEGQSYRYEDRDVLLGQAYYYWLEDVDMRGTATLHGPVDVTVPFRVYLPLQTANW